MAQVTFSIPITLLSIALFVGQLMVRGCHLSASNSGSEEGEWDPIENGIFAFESNEGETAMLPAPASGDDHSFSYVCFPRPAFSPVKRPVADPSCSYQQQVGNSGVLSTPFCSVPFSSPDSHALRSSSAPIMIVGSDPSKRFGTINNGFSPPSDHSSADSNSDGAPSLGGHRMGTSSPNDDGDMDTNKPNLSALGARFNALVLADRDQGEDSIVHSVPGRAPCIGSFAPRRIRSVSVQDAHDSPHD